MIFRFYRWYDNLEKRGKPIERFAIFWIILFVTMSWPALLIPYGASDDTVRNLGLISACLLFLSRFWYHHR